MLTTAEFWIGRSNGGSAGCKPAVLANMVGSIPTQSTEVVALSGRLWRCGVPSPGRGGASKGKSK